MTKLEAIKVLNNIESMFEQHEKDFEFAREKAALEMAIKSLQTPKRKTSTAFVPPTVEEVEEYIREKGLVVNADYFVDYYESKGWVVGRDKMKDWKATIRNWHRREQDKFKQQTTHVQPTKINPFDY